MATRAMEGRRQGWRKMDGDGSQGTASLPPERRADPHDLVKGTGKPDPNQHQPTDAEMNDLARLARQLQSADRDAPEKAANELEQIKEQAKDHGVKDLARQLKEALKKNPDNQPGGSKPSPFPDDPTRPPTGEGRRSRAKQGRGRRNGQPGEGKGGDGRHESRSRTPKDGTENDKTNDPLDPNELAERTGWPGQGNCQRPSRSRSWPATP